MARFDNPKGGSVEIVRGDLLEQDVDVIVNAWNRNVIPYWLLIPAGVSGAIRRRAGREPFRELRRHGPIPLGGAVMTTAGRLPLKAIIHVAGIDLLWRASERSIRDSVRNALRVAAEAKMQSIALPVIGGGVGGMGHDVALALMLMELEEEPPSIPTTIVEFRAN